MKSPFTFHSQSWIIEMAIENGTIPTSPMDKGRNHVEQCQAWPVSIYMGSHIVNPMWPVNSVRSQLALIWQICDANITLWFTIMTSPECSIIFFSCLPSTFPTRTLPLPFCPRHSLASPRPEYQNPATGTTPTTVTMELASWRQSGNNPNYSVA